MFFNPTDVAMANDVDAAASEPVLPPSGALSGDSLATIALLQTSSLTTLVQQDIERAILAGEYAPGSKLVEATLAEKMGVSRGPIVRLSACWKKPGWCAPKKSRRLCSRHSHRRTIEIFDLRAAMDELGRVNRRTSRPSAEGSQGAGRCHGTRREGDDTRTYHLLNLKFHDRLVEMVGNPQAHCDYRKLIKELALFRRLNLADGWLMPISAGEHRQILEGHRLRRP